MLIYLFFFNIFQTEHTSAVKFYISSLEPWKNVSFCIGPLRMENLEQIGEFIMSRRILKRLHHFTPKQNFLTKGSGLEAEVTKSGGLDSDTDSPVIVGLASTVDMTATAPTNSVNLKKTISCKDMMDGRRRILPKTKLLLDQIWLIFGCLSGAVFKNVNIETKMYNFSSICLGMNLGGGGNQVLIQE